MSRAITKRTFAIAIAIAAILACACTSAFATPPKAHAGELAPAELTAQSAESNTTMYYAQKLKSGKGVIGSFEFKDSSNTILYENCSSSRRAVVDQQEFQDAEEE